MPPEGRRLGIDPGAKRVGLAVSDPLGITAQGLDTFRRGHASFFDHLAGLIAEYAVVELVVGHPRRLDGGEGESALSARRLAETLRRRFDLPVQLWDERFSTEAAKRSYPKGSRKDWDRAAAMFILQSFLDAQRGEDD